jgi:hypothetical protein
VNFVADLWAGIQAREASGNWFGRVAKALVTAALARLSHLERVFGVGAGEFLLLSMPASLKQAR